MAKIAFVGAGSLGFTRGLVIDMMSWEDLASSTISLIDVDGERLQYAERAVKRIMEVGKYPAKVEATTDRRKGLEGADVVIASDPDADRMAAAVPDGDGWLYFKGGHLAALLAWWTLDRMQAQGTLPKRGLAARTIITSDLVDAVAESFGAEIINNLPVGFKYIGKIISESEGSGRFIFGAEQSYGFAKGTYCRDKDAAIAALLLVELCEHLKRDGRTVIDLLHDLWRAHGYHAERATPIRMEGVAGRERIGEIMETFRAGFPPEVAGVAVTEVWDLLSDEVIDPRTGSVVRQLGWHPVAPTVACFLGLGQGRSGCQLARSRLI